MRRLAIASLFVIMVICSVRADSERNFQLRKSIVAEQKRIEELKELSSGLSASRKEFAANHKERISSRNADIRRIIEDMTALSAEYRKEQGLLSIERNKMKNYEVQFAQYKSSLKSELKDYYAGVKKGLPYRLDERTAALDRLLNEADIQSVRSEEIFNRFTTIMYKDLNTGFDSEVFTHDRQRILRVGWLFMAARQEGAEAVKLLDMKNGQWSWRDDCNLAARKELRDAIEMVEGKKTPALVEFPVPLTLVRESMKGGARK